MEKMFDSFINTSYIESMSFCLNSTPRAEFEFDHVSYDSPLSSSPYALVTSSRTSHGKGIKRTFTNDEEMSQSCNKKKMRPNYSYFNFSEISKELQDIENYSRISKRHSGDEDFTESDNDRSLCDLDATGASTSACYYSLNECCVERCFWPKGFLQPYSMDQTCSSIAICSTRLNSTDVDTMNISSASCAFRNPRRLTL